MINVNDLSTETDGLKRQAKDALDKARDRFADQAYYLRDFAADARYNTEDFIQTNPWQAVAIAAGIGFIVGALVGSRR